MSTAEVERWVCGCDALVEPTVVASEADPRHLLHRVPLVDDDTRELLERVVPNWREKRIRALSIQPDRLTLERFEQPYRVHLEHAATFVETIGIRT